MGQQKLKILQQ